MENSLKLYTDILLDLIKQDIDTADRMCKDGQNRYAFQVGVYENTIEMIKTHISWYEKFTKGETDNGNDVMGD